MEIYQIENLDCREKANRKILLKETMKALKLHEKPERSYLEKVATSVGRKYGVSIQWVTQNRERLQASLRIGKESYKVLECHSYYELLCKIVLIAKAYKDFRKLKVK